MRTIITAAVLMALFGAGLALAQGTTSMYYIGPFEGQVDIKDYRTPGPPGYYYHPEETDLPSRAQCYDHPVRCDACGHWRDLGKACPLCGKPANQREQLEARQGTIYSPRPIPGQYWYDRPMRSVTAPKMGIGWPYLSPRYQLGVH